VARAEAYLHAKFHLDPSNRLVTITTTSHTGHTGQIRRTVLQTVAQKVSANDFDNDQQPEVAISLPTINCVTTIVEIRVNPVVGRCRNHSWPLSLNSWFWKILRLHLYTTTLFLCLKTWGFFDPQAQHVCVKTMYIQAKVMPASEMSVGNVLFEGKIRVSETVMHVSSTAERRQCGSSCYDRLHQRLFLLRGFKDLYLGA